MSLISVLFLVLLFCSMCSGYRSQSASLREPKVPKIGCVEAERQALLSIKHNLHGIGYTVDDFLSSWADEDDKRDCCKWLGIRCANESGHVVGLDLSPSALGVTSVPALGGKISPSLFELRYLSYLDLSYVDFNGSQIPSSIGTLTQLRYLSLSSTYLSGKIPSELANLTRLEHLYMIFNYYNVTQLEWLGHLSSLRILDLSYTNLSRASDWAQRVSQLSSLTTLSLISCDLPYVIDPSSLSFFNSSTSLTTLDLSSNCLSRSVFPWLFNFSHSLAWLDLSSNCLQGSIPKAFDKMTFLKYLYLQDNKLRGSIPDIFGNMSNLLLLNLAQNMLEGELPRSTWNLSTLNELIVGSNNLSGHLPEVMSQLKQLVVLDASRNHFRGEISQAHFSNLSKLDTLDLSSNSLSLNFQTNWTPPFRLRHISLGSCKLGPQFPRWLRTHKGYSLLNISNSGISDSIPNWFWDVSTSFQMMDLSNNQINGGIGNNISLRFADYNTQIDLSSNQLEGPVPLFLLQVNNLNLFKNRFSKINLICNITREMPLEFLDVSNNDLSGELPDCWSHFKSLEFLFLANNKLSGRVPSSIGSLNSILSLNLNNNKFIGELPSTLKNCTELAVIEIGGNNLSGMIPSWLGNSFSTLFILSLRSNRFYGGMPNSICHLSNLQVLDLSFNDISGRIPNCIGNFTAMTKAGSKDIGTTITLGIGSYEMSIYGYESKGYDENVLLEWKGEMAEFRSTLGLVKSIDLSSNKLVGEIPKEITELSELVSLNLSRNMLRGHIPADIGHMESLDFLDLSRNQLVGQIPQSLAQIDRLNTLDLSYNSLSGKIPRGTQLQSFEASAYTGNEELCGAPLPKNCSDTEQAMPEAADEESDEVFDRGFYISMAIGFVIAFWGVCGGLIFNKSFRYAYFNLLNDVGDQIYVTTALQKAKLLRMIKG